MLRRSRIFRHLFLDVAQHPNLIFRSFLKVLEHNRVNVTHILRRQGEAVGQEAFAIPADYTIFVSENDYAAISEFGEERVLASLSEQFNAFLKTPAARIYDTPYLQGVSFRLAIDGELGLERNEYYFAWERNSLVGVVGRLDLFVRGERVESFDVPMVPVLGIGTTREEHIRLDRAADREVYLPPGVSLWVTHEGGRLTLLNRSGSALPILVDAAPLPPDQVLPLRDGSRIAVGPDLCLRFVAEAPPKEGTPVVRRPTREDIEEVLGLLGVEQTAEPTAAPPGAGVQEPPPARPAGPAPRPASLAERGATETAPAPALARLEVVGSVLTTQMFEHIPGGALCLGRSSRCHIVLRAADVRPVHAELLLSQGRLYLGNRSGRRAVHYGFFDVPVQSGRRCRLTVGDPIRLGRFRLHLEPPFSPVGRGIREFFGANYLGNLIFGEPQGRLVVDLSASGPITIGRDETCDWVLASPYLWPRHAELVPRGGPLIRPVADALQGSRAVLFVNMQRVLDGGKSHVLRCGDYLVLGNLILRYTSSAMPSE